MKIVVIGGGAGGAGAAARCRRLSEESDITIFERSGYASYSNCGLPYKFSDEIPKFGGLIMTSPEALLKQYKLKVKVNHEVVSIDAKNRILTVKQTLTGQTFKEKYDKLIIAAGASAIVPNLPGVKEAKNVFKLKTPDDVLEVEKFVEENNPKSVVVIGGGSIGIEIAENYKHSGLDVTIVDQSDHLLPRALDADMSAFVHKAIVEGGIKLLLETSVVEVKSNTVVLSSGKEISADMVFMTVGVKPELKLLESAQLKIGKTGGVIVDEKQQTSDENIYAAGDLAEVKDIFGGTTRIALAFPASRQAVVAANNIFDYKNAHGKNDIYVGSTGASTLSIFNTTVASVGLNEVELNLRGIKYNKTVNARGANIGPVKGGGLVFLKVLYADDFTILGAQAAGPAQSEKRISYMSLAIQAGIKYDQFMDFMVAYSPKVDTSYDATTMGSRLAMHQADGSYEAAYVEELADLIKEGYEVIDVREPDEWVQGTIEGVKTISLSNIRNELDSLDKDGKYVLHCKTGARSYNATLVLKAKGFKNVKNLAGGYIYYSTYKDYGKITNENCCIK